MAAGLAHAGLKCISVLWSPGLRGPWLGHWEGWAGGSRRSHRASSGYRGSVHLSVLGVSYVAWRPQEKLSSGRGWESKGGSETVMP